MLDEAQRGEFIDSECTDVGRAGGLIVMIFLEPGSHIDDEYAKVGLYEPKIVITTSRDPSSRLLQFAKVRFVPCSVLSSLELTIPSVFHRNCDSSFPTRTV